MNMAKLNDILQRFVNRIALSCSLTAVTSPSLHKNDNRCQISSDFDLELSVKYQSFMHMHIALNIIQCIYTII
jgi:hypothetical protein